MQGLEAPKRGVSWVLGEVEYALAPGDVGAPGATMCPRSDTWGHTDPTLLGELRSRGLAPAALTDLDADFWSNLQPVVVLSVSSDVLQRVWRHRTTGHRVALFRPWQSACSHEARAWLSSELDEEAPIPLDRTKANLLRVLSELRGKTAVLVNMFRAVSEERPIRPAGAGESLRERIRRANLVVAELSHATGALVADVDSALARVGSRVLGSDHALTSEAARSLAAAEIARVLATLER
jgi:hypothetical protein